jgi:uncharacterized protein (TIGR02145 family)
MANKAVYGLLYNWFTLADPRGLCPTDWHVPSDAEWTELTTFLGGEALAGGPMKTTGTLEAGTGLWSDPNAAATNSSGFSVLPAGSRAPIGGYEGFADLAFFWSSSEFSTSNAYYRVLAYYDGVVFRFNLVKTFGFAVRCLKDE